MTTMVGPGIRPLERGEIDAILARNHVGRIAYSWRNQIDVEPIHYVYADDWIYARTSEGEKYRLVRESAYGAWPVAFEVDEVEGMFRWRSVVVRGNAYLVEPPDRGGDPEDWTTAVRELRTLIPDTLREGDPVPFRTHLLRIAVQEATGREAVPEI